MKTIAKLDKTAIDEILYNIIMLRIKLSKSTPVQQEKKLQKSLRKYISKVMD